MGSALIVVTEDWYFLSHRLALAKLAQESGFHVTVATAPGKRGNEIRAAGLEHEVFSLDRRSTNPVRESRTVWELSSLMRRLRPDIVHLVGAKPIVYGNWAAAIAGRPCVLNAVAGLGYLYLGGGAGRLLMRSLYEMTFRLFVRNNQRARVLVQNRDDRAVLLDQGMARAEQFVVVTGSGVDLRRFQACPEPTGSPLVVLMHSRMLWDKGVRELVEATRLLRSRTGLTFVVRLVGAPDSANPASISEEQLLRWAAEGVIEWLGRRDDIPAELRRCHVACLPSYREGAPLSLIEAAAVGRAIVTTDVPGCREVVRHQENGLLVPARDAEGLAAALERLLSDSALRQRLARSGRERAEREFSSDVINGHIIETYCGMLGHVARPAHGEAKATALPADG